MLYLSSIGAGRTAVIGIVGLAALCLDGGASAQVAGGTAGVVNPEVDPVAWTAGRRS